MKKVNQKKEKRNRSAKTWSCAKNFMLAEKMKGNPYLAQYADLYQSIADQELSLLKINIEAQNVEYK
jgi:hypothetical protein